MINKHTINKNKQNQFKKKIENQANIKKKTQIKREKKNNKI